MEAALVSAVRAGGTSLESLLAAGDTSSALNKPSSSGVTALHVSVWRNRTDLSVQLLEAGADPNVADQESGWTSVHTALYWGNLQNLAELLQHGGSLVSSDWKGRTPLDLVSEQLKEYLGPGVGDVFSWGNGSNYTLGTGSTAVQLAPARIESLHDAQAVLLSAAKFHSAVVTLDGKLYTFGWGRGGRLGHPEAHIHSGESAVIAPRLVSSLGKRHVLAVAAAKHHTVFCTTAGEVFTMGSNRHGQLGYAVDTQPTPRRVAALRARVVTVAAANKHSVAVSSSGDVFTWGSNVLGQLGYGTSDSASNVNPRLVEAMKGKRVQQAAAAKRHTLVLTTEGEVFTWGHRGVSPRRVMLAGTRDVLTPGGQQLWFHRGHQDVFRPQAVAICAGAAHSSVLTRTGVVLCWRSADPALTVQEVGGAISGKRVVSISAGKYRTAVVTDEGDLYMWEGRADYFPAEGRQSGSGSKKAGRDKGKPIPGAGFATQMVGSLGNGSPSPVEVGSFGSHSRKGSYFDRFVREREAAQAGGVSLPLRPASATKPSQSDVFAKVLPERVEGLKRAACVAVGEKHSLALQRWSAAQLPGLPRVPWLAQAAVPGTEGDAGEDDTYNRAADGLTSPRSQEGSDTQFSSPDRGVGSPPRLLPHGVMDPSAVGVPSLHLLCEEAVARQLVDPRTALQVLEYADVAGAELLRAYCLAVTVCNLDAVLLEARGALETLPPHLLAELERLWKLRLSGGSELGSGDSWGPAPGGNPYTCDREAGAVPEPAGPEGWEVGQPGEGERGEELDGQGGAAAMPARSIGSRLQPGARPTAAPLSLDWSADMLHASPSKLALQSDGQSSFKDKAALHAEAAVQRLARALQKKLQQIASLEERAAEGAQLDAQQLAKVATRPVVISALAALEGGMPVEEVQVILKAAGSDKEELPQLLPNSVTSGHGSNPALYEGGRAKQPGSSSKAAKRAPPAKPSTPSSLAPAAQLHAEFAQLYLGAAGGGSSAASASEPATGAAAPPGSTGVPAQEAARVMFSDSVELLGTSPTATVPAFGPLGHASERSPGEPGTQVVGGFKGLDEPRSLSAERARSAGTKSKEKAKRKGGLSMFLRGELEKTAVPNPSSPTTSASAAGSSPAPAWGSSMAQTGTAGATSLKDILSQEAAATAGPSSVSKPASSSKVAAPGSAARAKPVADPQVPPAGGLKMSLANFMAASNPMAIQRAAPPVAPKPPPPAWGGTAGASPPAAARFRLIQEEQQALAAARSFGTSPVSAHRPPSTVAAAPITNLPPWRAPAPALGASSSTAIGGAAGGGAGLLGTSPTASSGLHGTSPSGRAAFQAAPVPKQSKWYVPEERRIKSIKSIQTEEVVVKELSKKYGAGNVRIVPKARPTPGLPTPSAAKH